MNEGNFIAWLPDIYNTTPLPCSLKWWFEALCMLGASIISKLFLKLADKKYKNVRDDGWFGGWGKFSGSMDLKG